MTHAPAPLYNAVVMAVAGGMISGVILLDSETVQQTIRPEIKDEFTKIHEIQMTFLKEQEKKGC